MVVLLILLYYIGGVVILIGGCITLAVYLMKKYGVDLVDEAMEVFFEDAVLWDWSTFRTSLLTVGNMLLNLTVWPVAYPMNMRSEKRFVENYAKEHLEKIES